MLLFGRHREVGLQKVEVTNVTGELIKSVRPCSEYAEIHLDNKTAGVYFLLITGQHQRLVKQLIVR